MNIHDTKTVFLHGISGSGMRGLAWILLSKGKQIRGSDAVLTPDLPEKYSLMPEKEAGALLTGVDMYVCSDAVAADHPLRVKATTRNIPVLTFAECLGQLTAGYKTIAVAGTHGKSSTTAFLAHILITAGLDPTVLVGAAIPTWPGEYARLGASDIFVVEADEYRNHFHHLTPNSLVVVTIEHDHPDFFANLVNVVESFQKLIDAVPADGAIITTQELLKQNMLDIPATALHTSTDADFAPIAGSHMRTNAGLALKAAELLGVATEDAAQSLHTFPGLSRRFETLGTFQGAQIISDYGHHPTEIAATLAATRQTFPGKSVAVIFEAHTADRLQSFQEEFALALQAADAVVFYPPFVALGRQASDSSAALTAIEETIKKTDTPTQTIVSPTQLPDALTDLAKQYDIILACTAGSLDTVLRVAVKNT